MHIREETLDLKSNELIGLTCSIVLRCDDRNVSSGKFHEVGLTTEQVNEAMGITKLIGGTIVVPHHRRAFEYWEEMHHVQA